MPARHGVLRCTHRLPSGELYTIFLVYWAKTPREVVLNTLNLLISVTNRIGIVANKVDLATHVRYGDGDYNY